MKNKKLFAILTLVCFMFTLMPVAAFADETRAVVENSFVWAEDTEVDVEEKVELTFSFDDDATTETVYVWFEVNENVPTTALGTINDEGEFVQDADGILEFDGGDKVEVAFKTAGTYELHAAFANPAAVYEDDENSYDTWSKAIASIIDQELTTESGSDVVTVSKDAADTSKYEIVNITVDGEALEVEGEAVVVKDNKSATIEGVPSNGIEGVDVAFELVDKDDNAVDARNIKVTSGNKVVVSDLKAKRTGEVSFTATAEKVGTHRVYVEIDGYKATFKLNASESEAERIEVDYVSKNPVNIDTVKDGVGAKLVGSLTFVIYDEAGTKMTDGNTSGFGKAVTSDEEGNYNYVSVVEQPAKAKIKNSDLKLAWKDNGKGSKGWTIDGAKMTAEGTYTFKVALNDGTYAKATLTVKEAGDPVALKIVYNTTSVQLGASIEPKSIIWMDENNVSTPADGIEFAASGAAVETVTLTEEVEGEDKVVNRIKVKDEDKYVGSEINVVVVDKENDLIATTTLTVASEAKELVFDTTEVPVDTTRTIGVKLVDENGKAVTLNGDAKASVIVLKKPAGSDVTANAGTVDAVKGAFDIAFSADTVGMVELQAVLQADQDGVVRYYTGTTTIAVGGGSNGAVVVMSINSNQMVVGDKVVDIPAPAVIVKDRTFVPFRALTEAFGAEVAWDAATQSVTAELDGVTVVLTIGSPVYTVNGVEYEADVAPFIAGDGYTMVPVRLVAEAFGYTVEYTVDANGAVADILFI